MIFRKKPRQFWEGFLTACIAICFFVLALLVILSPYIVAGHFIFDSVIPYYIIPSLYAPTKKVLNVYAHSPNALELSRKKTPLLYNKLKTAEKCFIRESEIQVPRILIWKGSDAFQAIAIAESTIVITEALITEADPCELAVVLGHEFYHIKRYKEDPRISKYRNLDEEYRADCYAVYLTGKNPMISLLERRWLKDDKTAREEWLLGQIFPNIKAVSDRLYNEYVFHVRYVTQCPEN